MLHRVSSALILSLSITALASTAACDRDRKPTQDPQPIPADTASPEAKALTAFADAIDPGPVAPMSDDLPDWLAQRIAEASSLSDPARVAMVEQTVEAFSQPDALSLLTQQNGLLALAQSVAILEARVRSGEATVDDLAALQKLYAILDQPTFANNRGMFSQFLPAIVAAAQTSGEAEHLAEIEQLVDTLFERMRRAEPLRRRLVAELLRNAPTHAAIPGMLASIAENVGRIDPKLGLQAVELARDLDPEPGPTEHLDVAYRCCVVLDLACADAAIERATANPDALDDAARTRLTSVTESRSAAAEVLATEAATDADGRIAHARALIELGLHARATEAYNAVRSDFPTDARAVAGLARLAILTRIDIAAAAAVIHDAGALDHKDAEYYEIAIGARVLRLFNDVLPQVMAGGTSLEDALAGPFAPLRADIEGYAGQGSELAEVLLALLDLTERGLPLLVSGDQAGQAKLLRASFDEAVALQKRLPNQPHAYVLLMSAAELMPDKRAAVAAASTPAPTGEPALLVRQAKALLNLAIAWDDPKLLPIVAEHIAKIPAGDHDRELALTSANMIAIEARMQGVTTPPEQAVDLYYGLFQSFQDPNAVNNLAVLLWLAGDVEQAKAGLDSAIALGGDKAIVAQVNRLALEATPESTAGLEAIVADERANASVRRLALRWLASRSTGKAKAGFERQRKQSLAEPTLLPHKLDLPNSTGVVLLGELDFDVSYSAEGLHVVADAHSEPWAVILP